MTRDHSSDGGQMLGEVAVVYKLTTGPEWRDALATGTFHGSADDRRDGFIHFSTASQLAGTAQKYFSGVPDLVLVAVDVAELGTDLWWEPSRGGELFPHLYAPLAVSASLWTQPIALDDAGLPILPEEFA